MAVFADATKAIGMMRIYATSRRRTRSSPPARMLRVYMTSGRGRRRGEREWERSPSRVARLIARARSATPIRRAGDP